MTPDKLRKETEAQILGCCINFEGLAYKAVDILRATNFKDDFHRDLFQVIYEMTAKVPLDLLTVTKRYHQKYPGRSDSYRITVLTSECYLSDITYHCLCLLEIDIREKVLFVLESKEKKYAKSEDFNLAAIMKQTSDHIRHPQTDIFEGLDNIYNYLVEHLQNDSQDIKSIIAAIPQVVRRIKKSHRVSYIIDQISTIANQQGHINIMDEVSVLRDALILLLHSKRSPDYIKKATQLISKELYANF